MKATWIQLKKNQLIGGFNPFEKYAREIASSPQELGWTFQKMLTLRRAARTVTDAQLDVQDSRLPRPWHFCTVDEWFGGKKYTGMYLFYYFGWLN